MSDVKEIIEKSENTGLRAVGYVSKHRTVIIVVVICAAVLAAIVQTQSYLNPTRNEAKYTELKSSFNTKSIDNETLEKLQATQSDKTETVDSNFVPDRNNPFTE